MTSEPKDKLPVWPFPTWKDGEIVIPEECKKHKGVMTNTEEFLNETEQEAMW